jgi:hypothetical protein
MRERLHDGRLLKLFSPKKGGRRRQAGRKREREDGREGWREGEFCGPTHTRIKFQKNKALPCCMFNFTISGNSKSF